jgi:hypothetical protein
MVMSTSTWWYGPRNEPPGPIFAWPLVGDTPKFATQGVTDYTTGRVNVYGPIFQTSLVFKPFVVVADAASVRQLMLGEDDTVVSKSPNTPIACYTELLGAEFLYMAVALCLGVNYSLGTSHVYVEGGTKHPQDASRSNGRLPAVSYALNHVWPSVSLRLVVICIPATLWTHACK